jgi:hypothetical protein
MRFCTGERIIQCATIANSHQTPKRYDVYCIRAARVSLIENSNSNDVQFLHSARVLAPTSLGTLLF